MPFYSVGYFEAVLGAVWGKTWLLSAANWQISEGSPQLGAHALGCKFGAQTLYLGSPIANAKDGERRVEHKIMGRSDRKEKCSLLLLAC